MLKPYITIYILCALAILLVEAESECALNTVCKHIRDCPVIRDNFNSFHPKPYCNLHLPGTYVCCYQPAAPYTQEKDNDLRIVKECKSYENIGRHCDAPLIVDGTKAEPKEFPFMALLYYRNGKQISYLCGGTLISKRYVLTAAHCFVSSVFGCIVGVLLEAFYVISIPITEPNWVRLGELDYATTADDATPLDIAIKKTILHDQYRVQTKYNDIALVELLIEVEFNDYIAPACLPLIDGNEFNKYLAAGWGNTRDTGDSTTHLLKVLLDRFNNDNCHQLIESNEELEYGVNNLTQLCAGSLSDSRDTCYGDSGGPLFVDHPDFKCQHLVLGITSFGEGGCGNKGYPSVYTRISHYTEWIKNIVWH